MPKVTVSDKKMVGRMTDEQRFLSEKQLLGRRTHDKAENKKRASI